MELSINDIKEETKLYKLEHPEVKHIMALNIIAQKYGFIKYEVLKASADNNDIIIVRDVDWIKTQVITK